MVGLRDTLIKGELSLTLLKRFRNMSVYRHLPSAGRESCLLYGRLSFLYLMGLLQTYLIGRHDT